MFVFIDTRYSFLTLSDFFTCISNNLHIYLPIKDNYYGNKS